MPYSFTTPDDLPLAPPRNTTIPARWDQIKNQGRKTISANQPKAEKPRPEAATAGHLGLFVAHISHRLAPIPGALDAFREAVKTLMPVLYPNLPATPPGAPS